MKLLLTMLGVMLSLSAHANDAAFKKTRSTTIIIGKGCDFRLLVPKNSEIDSRYESTEFGNGTAGLTLENPWSLTSKNYIAPFYFNFTCYPANNGRTTGKPVRYNEKTKQWERDINNRFESWYDEEDRKALDHAIQFYALGTANAQGYAYTEDDVIGDERYRLRRLRYCLFKDAKALCGDGDMGYLQDGKKRDLTPYALHILRSIEFIDDTPAPESAPASVQDTTTAPP